MPIKKSAPARKSLDCLLSPLDLVDVVDGPMIETNLEKDANILWSKEMLGLLEKFLSLSGDYEKKSKYKLNTSSFLNDYRHILETMAQLQKDIIELSGLFDKNENMRQAQSPPMAEWGQFMNMKNDEAKTISRKIFLQLNSSPFKTLIRKMIHEFQKRLSYYKAIDNNKPAEESISFP